MIRKIKKILGISTAKKPKTDFSDFFQNASAAEKKKLFKSVIREANKEQKDLVMRYEVLKAKKGAN